MINRWMKGRDEIDALLVSRDLERVPANRDLADQLIADAKNHVELAKKGLDVDPIGAFQLAYDATRKALDALLVNQGLRSTSKGGHYAILEAIRAQFGHDSPLADEFGWMRPLRNNSEYPNPDKPRLSNEDAREGVDAAVTIIDLSLSLLDQMPPYGR